MVLRPLRSEAIAQVVAAFAALGWGGKDAAQYARYLAEHEAGTRVTRFAFIDELFVGYLNVVWQSGYPPFAAEHIPEINDFNVLPDFRKQGIGTALMDEAERVIATRSPHRGHRCRHDARLWHGAASVRAARLCSRWAWTDDE